MTVKVHGEWWPHPTKPGRRRRVFVAQIGDHRVSLTKKGAKKLLRGLLKALAVEEG